MCGVPKPGRNQAETRPKPAAPPPPAARTAAAAWQTGGTARGLPVDTAAPLALSPRANCCRTSTFVPARRIVHTGIPMACCCPTHHSPTHLSMNTSVFHIKEREGARRMPEGAGGAGRGQRRRRSGTAAQGPGEASSWHELCILHFNRRSMPYWAHGGTGAHRWRVCCACASWNHCVMGGGSLSRPDMCTSRTYWHQWPPRLPAESQPPWPHGSRLPACALLAMAH